MRTILLLAVGISIAPAAAAWADAPPMIAGTTICSAARSFCASGDKARHVTSIWRRATGPSQTLWTLPGLYSQILLADDGNSAVTFPAGFLLDEPPRPTRPALLFHRPNQPPIPVRLDQLVATPMMLPRTVSHRYWLRRADYVRPDLFLLETVEGRRFRFDPRTGRHRG